MTWHSDVQVVQYRAAAQLLADQGLTGRLLDTANWLLDPDGGGEAPCSSVR